MAKGSARVHPFATKFTAEIGPNALRKHMAGRGFSPRQEFFFWLFQQWLEINSTLSRLQLAREFLGRLGPRGVNADAVAYHVEKHLEEVYVLYERVKTFLAQVERKLKRKGLADDSERTARLRERFLRAIDPLIRTRGAHVHQRRFLDGDIGQLEVLDGLVQLRRTKDLKRHRERLARKVLLKWRRTVGSRHKRLSQLVNGVLQDLDRIVFEKLPPAPP